MHLLFAILKFICFPGDLFLLPPLSFTLSGVALRVLYACVHVHVHARVPAPVLVPVPVLVYFIYGLLTFGNLNDGVAH